MRQSADNNVMTFAFEHIGLTLIVLFLVFGAGPAGLAYYLWRLTRNAQPRRKLTLRTGSVVLTCVAVAATLLTLFIAFMYGLHPA